MKALSFRTFCPYNGRQGSLRYLSAPRRYTTRRFNVTLSSYSRTAVYTHAQRVVQAVTREQAGGPSYDALWQENERLKAENAALWQAWSEAEEFSEAKQRAFAGSGCAMGLSLSQIVTL